VCVCVCVCVCVIHTQMTDDEKYLWKGDIEKGQTLDKFYKLGNYFTFPKVCLHEFICSKNSFKSQ